jgi:hypothetical protein
MPTYRFSHPSHALAACCLLALSGCASEALNNQLANSHEAVDQARIAGAEQGAPEVFHSAADKLQQADAAAKGRDKKEAMRLAQQALVDANLARARTDSAQARFAATEMQKSNQLLRQAMIRANQNQ